MEERGGDESSSSSLLLFLLARSLLLFESGVIGLVVGGLGMSRAFSSPLPPFA